MNPRLILPLSIVFGSVIIATGLYFGLRERPLPTPIPAQPLSPSLPLNTPSVVETPPVTPVVPEAPEVPVDTVAVVIHDATAALAELKTKVFVPQCWNPALEKQPMPETSVYTVSITFDAAGNEVARGISEHRDTDSRPDVANCLRNFPLQLTVPAPRTTTQVNLPLVFP